MVKKRIRVRVLKVRLELNDENGTLVDCELKAERGQRRRHLWIEGVFTAPTHRQERHISKAIREAIRVAERARSKQ